MLSMAKKVTLVPPSQTGGSDENSGEISIPIEKTDKIKLKIYDKIHRFIQLSLQLANHKAYDEQNRIKTESGNYLEKSNLVDLLTQAMSPGKVLHGEQEFIALLSRCNVDPDLILNDNMKSKLINMKTKKSFNKEISQNVLDESESTESFEKSRPVKKGNKKFIVVNDDQEMELELSPRSFKRKILIDNDEAEPVIINNKRKRSDEHDPDDVEDHMINQQKWQI